MDPDPVLQGMREAAFAKPRKQGLTGFVIDEELARKYKRAVSKKWKAYKKAQKKNDPKWDMPKSLYQDTINFEADFAKCSTADAAKANKAECAALTKAGNSNDQQLAELKTLLELPVGKGKTRWDELKAKGD